VRLTIVVSWRACGWQLVLKRLVCIAKAKGDVADAIFRLNEYLGTFQMDGSAVSEKGTTLYAKPSLGEECMQNGAM
jgi:hypothetical protein